MTSPTNGDGQATVDDLTGDFTTGAWSVGFPTTVAALFSGVKWGDAIGSGATITYSFPGIGAIWAAGSGPQSYSNLNEPGSFTPLAAYQAVAARSALSAWAAVANINFQEVPDTPSDVGLIRISWTDVTQTTAAGWAYYPNKYFANGGDIWLVQPILAGDTLSDWQPGGGDYSVLLHEIGHTLGLKHPFESSVYAPVTLPVSEDSQQYTVMSYTSNPHDLYRTVMPDGTPGFIVINPDTPMIDDIMAIQYVYGANTGYHSGNDTYTFNPDTPFFHTIWDGGGTDTISVSNFNDGCILSLIPGTFSKITILSAPLPPGYIGGTVPTYDGTDNLGIAFNCWIENAIGGAGNDTLIGNLAGNVLTGGAGNDTIDGGLGIDTAVYSAARSGYTITKAGAHVTVSGADGTDTLSNIEWLQFSDVLIKLGSHVVDPNGDGKSDLLWRNTDGTLGIWQMDGTRPAADSYYAVSTSWSVLDGHGDYNGDGKSDILWRNTDGTLGIWQMDGTHPVADSYYAVGTTWSVLDGNGDYNGDGKSDLLWRNTDGTLGIWQMDGTHLAADNYYAVGTSWGVLDGHGDYNGDGKSDILWRNTDGTLGIWQMDGTHVASDSYYAVGTSWSVIDSHGDYNGDGKNDILWRNTDGTLGIWQMDGTHLAADSYFAVGTSWSVIDGHGDYNGDGKSDILWRNTDGTLGIWEMDGTHLLADSYFAVGTSWSVIDGHGDYNGDGKSDILWRNTDGTLGIWQMDGTHLVVDSYYAVNTSWGTVDGTESGAALSGDNGNNTLLGTVNNDTLSGQGGNDTLTGNAGADKFVFDTALDASTNVDTITDFASGSDKIMLDHLIFSALSTGNVAAGNFVAEAGATAHDANEHILYDTSNGNLSYDPDGQGGLAATLFATLANHPALAVADLAVV